jgi:hypothetical protein
MIIFTVMTVGVMQFLVSRVTAVGWSYQPSVFSFVLAISLSTNCIEDTTSTSSL